jgi:succinate dehydrogenase / fumarate reductase iron-sulfur subunit
MKLKLKIWRQKNAQDKGAMVDYQIDGIEPDMSFLEMLDVFNEDLSNKEDSQFHLIMTVAKEFAECVLYINGEAHGPDRGVTTCQLHMRMFNDGDTITIEPPCRCISSGKDLVVAIEAHLIEFNMQEDLYR